MSEKPKHRFWHVGLRTLLAVMLLIGVLLWLNFRNWHGLNGDGGTLGWPINGDTILVDDGESIIFRVPYDNIFMPESGLATTLYSYDAFLRCYIPDVIIGFLIVLSFSSTLDLIAHRHERRRRWFQFHLSTLNALTLTAGALLYVNTCERGYGPREINNRIYGWPFDAAWQFPLHDVNWDRYDLDHYRLHWHWDVVTNDFIVAVIILFCVAILGERLARCRKRGAA
jgi:hypothetical protein